MAKLVRSGRFIQCEISVASGARGMAAIGIGTVRPRLSQASAAPATLSAAKT